MCGRVINNFFIFCSELYNLSVMPLLLPILSVLFDWTVTL